MRRKDLKPGRLYKARTTLYGSPVPVLLADGRLWDLVPDQRGAALTLAPDDAVDSGVLDNATNARRGVLAVHVRPGKPSTGGSIEQLAALSQHAKTISNASGRALSAALKALRADLPEQLTVNVLSNRYFLQPWEGAVEVRCPECDSPVSLDGSSRMRRHDTPAGVRCGRSTTKLSAEGWAARAGKA